MIVQDSFSKQKTLSLQYVRSAGEGGGGFGRGVWGGGRWGAGGVGGGG